MSLCGFSEKWGTALKSGKNLAESSIKIMQIVYFQNGRSKH